MHRNKLLQKKSDQLRKELHAWATNSGILKAGERLEVSVSIVETDTNSRSEEKTSKKPEMLHIHRACRSRYDGEYLWPAKLTKRVTQEVVNRMPSGNVYVRVTDLLITRQNAPDLFFYSHLRTQANNPLKEPINGKYYRFAVGDEGVQLWEVRPVRA